jgi:hypothetical protein
MSVVSRSRIISAAAGSAAAARTTDTILARPVSDSSRPSAKRASAAPARSGPCSSSRGRTSAPENGNCAASANSRGFEPK